MARVVVFARHAAETFVTWSIAASFLGAVAKTVLERLLGEPEMLVMFVR